MLPPGALAIVYVKLFGTILTSSIWSEEPATRLVWITLLTLADEDGYVRAAPSGISRAANVPLKDAIKALKILEAPDLETGTQEYGGRRIERVEGGWDLLNYQKYREIRTKEQLQAARRMRRHRAKKNAESHRDDRDMSRPSVTGDDVTVYAEAYAEAETELASRETSKGESSTSVSTSLMKADSVPWINQALHTIKDSDFEDHRLLWEGRTVFSFWVWRRNKFLTRDPSEAEQARVIFTKDRKTRVNKWLITYGLEDCLLAVEGLFHHQDMQQKDGTSYTEFENVFRPQGGGTVEKLRDEGLRHRKPVDSILKRLREQGWHE